MAIDTLGANALANNSVTTAKIADDAVVAADIADDSVTTAKIADDAITQALIAAGAVGNTEVASGISASKLTAGNLPVGQMPASSILQIASTNTYIAGESQFDSGAYYNFPTLTVTPKSDNSTFLVVSFPRFYTRIADRASLAYGNTHIYVQDTTSAGTPQTKCHEWINYSDNSAVNTADDTDGFRVQYTAMATFANSSTSSRGFRTRAYSSTDSGGKGRIGGEYLYFQLAIELKG
tara:strand:- start:137 stop:844 length:708 start_codon:yes stop_codon:yes gene_type:complete